MLRLTVWFVFGLFTQLIAVIMWGEYVWFYKFANGGVGGTPIESIQPIFWWLIIVEIILFTITMIVKKRGERTD